MTPAEELKAAAALLREMAGKTSGGTWTAEYLDSHGCWWVTHQTETSGSTTYGTVADLESIDMAADAAWIALMSPAVAEPLAAWLDNTVRYVIFESGAVSGPEAGQRFFEDKYRHALAFARAITKADGQ